MPIYNLQLDICPLPSMADWKNQSATRQETSANPHSPIFPILPLGDLAGWLTPSGRDLDLGLRHNHKWDSKHNGWYSGYGGTTNSCENKPCFDSSLYMNTSQEFPGYPHSNILHGFYPSFHGEVKFHHMNHDQNSSDIQKTYPQDLPMISVPWVPWVPWVPSPWTISSEAFPVISSHCATIKRSVKLAVSTRSLYVSLGIGSWWIYIYIYYS